MKPWRSIWALPSSSLYSLLVEWLGPAKRQAHSKSKTLCKRLQP
jgi:hypothetical protein